VAPNARLIKYAALAAVGIGCLLIAGALVTVAVIWGNARSGGHLGIDIVAEMTGHAIMSSCLGLVLIVAGLIVRARFTRKIEGHG